MPGQLEKGLDIVFSRGSGCLQMDMDIKVASILVVDVGVLSVSHVGVLRTGDFVPRTVYCAHCLLFSVLGVGVLCAVDGVPFPVLVNWFCSCTPLYGVLLCCS